MAKQIKNYKADISIKVDFNGLIIKVLSATVETTGKSPEEAYAKTLLNLKRGVDIKVKELNEV